MILWNISLKEELDLQLLIVRFDISEFAFFHNKSIPLKAGIKLCLT